MVNADFVFVGEDPSEIADMIKNDQIIHAKKEWT